MTGRQARRRALVRFAQRLRAKRGPLRIVEIDEAAAPDDRSSAVAFVLGGVTIAGGLLALLYIAGSKPGPLDMLTSASPLNTEVSKS